MPSTLGATFSLWMMLETENNNQTETHHHWVAAGNSEQVDLAYMPTP